MNLIKTLAAATIAATVSLDPVTAWVGTVTLYEDINFGSKSVKIYPVLSLVCFSLDCFNDRASSVQWKDIPATSTSREAITIAFYTDEKCTGTVRKWKSTDPFPSNFVLDGINDQVSSFAVFETAQTPLYDYRCPLSTSGLLNEINAVNTTETLTERANISEAN